MPTVGAASETAKAGTHAATATEQSSVRHDTLYMNTMDMRHHTFMAAWSAPPWSHRYARRFAAGHPWYRPASLHPSGGKSASPMQSRPTASTAVFSAFLFSISCVPCISSSLCFRVRGRIWGRAASRPLSRVRPNARRGASV